jgi:hypothetical protein
LQPDPSRPADDPVRPAAATPCTLRPLLRAQQNLLVPLLHHARKALGELGLADAARPAVQRVVRAAARAEEMARRGAHAIGAAFAVCDLASISREVVQLFGGSLPGDVPLVQIARCKAPAVLGDESLLHQLVVEAIAAVGAAAGWGTDVEIHVEVDAGRGGWDDRRNHTRLSVRMVGVAGNEPRGLDPSQLGYARDLVALHCGEWSEHPGGVRVSLPAATAEPVLVPDPRRLAVGLDDGTLAVAHLDGRLRAAGRDVVTSSHASAAAGQATANAARVGLFFATSDDPHGAALAWLLEMAQLHPTIPRLLVVPDGLAPSPAFAAFAGDVEIVAWSGIDAALARLASRAPGHDANKG